MCRTIATALVCMLFAPVLWADCAPDYRSDKRAGAFIEDFIINEASNLGSSELAEIRNKLIGACADEQADDLEELIRALFQNEGYFAATVKNLDLKTLDPLAQPKHIQLEADVAVGQIYRLAEIKFVGNHAFAAAKLRNVFFLREGDVFKREKIAGSFVGVRKLYSMSGFGDLVFEPDTENLANSTVILTLMITEGPQYHMGKLKVFAKQDVAERLQSGWRLPEGAVFNFDYVGKYLEANRELLPRDFIPGDLRIVRNCPDASIEVRLILDQTAPTLQSQPTDVKCEESHDKAK
jgi:outer membrane translocation and assembly module TamA